MNSYLLYLIVYEGIIVTLIVLLVFHMRSMRAGAGGEAVTDEAIEEPESEDETASAVGEKLHQSFRWRFFSRAARRDRLVAKLTDEKEDLESLISEMMKRIEGLESDLLLSKDKLKDLETGDAPPARPSLDAVGADPVEIPELEPFEEGAVGEPEVFDDLAAGSESPDGVAEAEEIPEELSDLVDIAGVADQQEMTGDAADPDAPLSDDEENPLDRPAGEQLSETDDSVVGMGDETASVDSGGGDEALELPEEFQDLMDLADALAEGSEEETGGEDGSPEAVDEDEDGKPLED